MKFEIILKMFLILQVEIYSRTIELLVQRIDHETNEHWKITNVNSRFP